MASSFLSHIYLGAVMQRFQSKEKEKVMVKENLGRRQTERGGLRKKMVNYQGEISYSGPIRGKKKRLLKF